MSDYTILYIICILYKNWINILKKNQKNLTVEWSYFVDDVYRIIVSAHVEYKTVAIQIVVERCKVAETDIWYHISNVS